MIMDGESAPELSDKLNVNTGLLYKWRSEHLAELDTCSGGKRGSSPTQMAAERR